MLEISKVMDDFKTLVVGLKQNKYIDLVEIESVGSNHMEYKFSIESKALDLLKKWLEVNLFIQGISSGLTFPEYSCGPITNKRGWSVMHLRVEYTNTPRS